MEKSLVKAVVTIGSIAFCLVVTPTAGAGTVIAPTSDGRQLPIGAETTGICDTDCKYAIHGTVKAAPNSPVQIRITDHFNRTSVIYTDETGEYRLLHLAPGRYLIRPWAADMTFKPEIARVTITDSDVLAPVFEQVPFKDSLAPGELPPIDAPSGPTAYPETTILPNGKSVSAFAQSLGIDLSTGGKCQLVTATTQTQIQMAMVGCFEIFACPIGTKCFDLAAGTPISTEPAQRRYAYVLGGNAPSPRQSPATHKPPNVCPDVLYGFDCQGLVSYGASNASLHVTAGANNQSNPGSWTLPPNVSLIDVDDENGPIQTGDLVFWSGHDGVATASNAFISSTGEWDNSCADNIRRGPVNYTFAQFKRGQPTTVLRFVSNTSVNVAADPTSLPSTGGPVTLTATVTALASSSTTAPTGTVSFTDQTGATLCLNVPLQSGGTATCSKPISQAPDTISAAYSGDNNDNASSGSVTVTASSTPTSITFNLTVTTTTVFNFLGPSQEGCDGNGIEPIGTPFATTNTTSMTWVQTSPGFWDWNAPYGPPVMEPGITWSAPYGTLPSTVSGCYTNNPVSEACPIFAGNGTQENNEANETYSLAGINGTGMQTWYDFFHTGSTSPACITTYTYSSAVQQ